MGSRWLPRIARPGTGGGPPPPETVDHFSPRIIVGNVPAGDPNTAQAGAFRYIPDAGDCVGIALALSEAAALGVPVNIDVRPGTYTLDGSAVTLLTVPEGCVLSGAGCGRTVGAPVTRIIGKSTSGTSQRIVDVLDDAVCEDIAFLSPAPTVNTFNTGGNGIISTGEGSILRRCVISFQASANFDRVQTFAVFQNGSGSISEDLLLIVPSLFGQPTPVPGAGVLLGPTASVVEPVVAPIVRNCQQVGGNNAVIIQNVGGPRVEHYDAVNLNQPTAAFSYFVSVAPSAPLRGPVFHECSFTTDGVQDSSQVTAQFGFAINIDPLPFAEIDGFTLSDCRAEFGVANPLDVNVVKTGLQVRTSEGATIRGGMVVSTRVVRHNVGILIQNPAINLLGTIADIKFSACVCREAQGNTGPDQYNMLLDSSGENAEILRVSAVGCSLDTSFSGTAIRINDPAVRDTILVANNTGDPLLTIDDLGTGTEAAHNI